MPNTLCWFADPAMDVPELRSPQPCPRGNSCNYMIGDAPGCCRWVHPGEGGTGRRLFAAKEGKPPCVRLTGCYKDAGGGYYARRHAKMSWRQWAQQHGLPWTEESGPVTLLTMKGKPFPPDKQPQAPRKPAHLRQERVDLSVTVEFEPVLGVGSPSCSPGCVCVWNGKCMDRQADEASRALSEFQDRVAMHAVMQPGAYLRNITALPARNLDPEFAAAALEYDRECDAGEASPSLCFARGLGPRHTEGGCCAEGDATPTLLPRPFSACGSSPVGGTLAERFAHGAALSERCAESCLEPPPLTTIPGYTENEAPALVSSAVEYEEQD
jgi:hypothetical protein